MAGKALVWDEAVDRLFETGVDKGVLYPYNDETKKPGVGVAWNGLSSVQESPEGADATDIYADNMKYLSLRSVEKFKGTIEAYMAPDEWAECDGSAKPTGTVGLRFNQQKRKTFGLAYRTRVGNAVDGDDYGYKIHLVWGATAAPSSRQYQTVNDSPEAISMSWEFETTPVPVEGFRPIAHAEIDSTLFKTEKDKACLKALEDKLYGTEDTDPELPMPSELVTLLTPAT